MPHEDREILKAGKRILKKPEIPAWLWAVREIEIQQGRKTFSSKWASALIEI